MRCFIMNTKGDLSMNMIIIAAISLLVLAIIAYLIFGASDNITEGTSCPGQCLADSGECLSNNMVPATGVTCKEKGTVCCIEIGSNK